MFFFVFNNLSERPNLTIFCLPTAIPISCNLRFIYIFQWFFTLLCYINCFLIYWKLLFYVFFSSIFLMLNNCLVPMEILDGFALYLIDLICSAKNQKRFNSTDAGKQTLCEAILRIKSSKNTPRIRGFHKMLQKAYMFCLNLIMEIQLNTSHNARLTTSPA